MLRRWLWRAEVGMGPTKIVRGGSYEKLGTWSRSAMLRD